jgi:choline dehydrogenase
MKDPAIAKYVVSEYAPGVDQTSDEQLVQYLRDKGRTSFHPVSTCRMGPDPSAVVDERLRVKGFTGLRVIDASVMPDIVSGNTNAPTIMVAEKGADMVLADARAGAVKPAAKAKAA